MAQCRMSALGWKDLFAYLFFVLNSIWHDITPKIWWKPFALVFHFIRRQKSQKSLGPCHYEHKFQRIRFWGPLTGRRTNLSEVVLIVLRPFDAFNTTRFAYWH